MTDRARYAALWSQALVAVYLQAIEWIPMAPWNDLARGNGQERLDIAAAALSAVLVAGTYARRIWLVGLGVVVYGAWLWLQLDFWWRPYVFGATPRELAFHARWFGRTWAFLPSPPGHPAPDAAHLVLHGLILAALGATSVHTARLLRERRWRDRSGRSPRPYSERES